MAPTACGRDRDCPGEEICTAGFCTAAPAEPTTGTERAAEEPPLVPAATTCATDKECPGDLLCENRQCVAPKKAAAQAPAAKKCTRDKDCPGDDICKAGVCAAGNAAAPPASAAATAGAGRFQPAGETVRDTALNITWQKTPPGDHHQYVDAMKYCSDLTIGGSGWRLPNIEELMSLTPKPMRPQVQAAFPDLVGTFWSSSEKARFRMWVANLRFGTKMDQSIREDLSVLCVR